MEKAMKKLMEGWRQYVKEAQIAKMDGPPETVRPVYKTENWFVYKMGKTREGVYYALGHLPSGMVIPSSYYVARGGPRGKKWQSVAYLADYLESTITADDVSSPDISKETIKQIQHAIINSEFARPNMSYTKI